MNSDKEKSESEKKANAVQEPEIKYEQETDSTDSKKLHPILEKLILKSKQDAVDGKGISHEEMMRRVKLRYPFLK